MYDCSTTGILSFTFPGYERSVSTSATCVWESSLHLPGKEKPSACGWKVPEVLYEPTEA